MHYWTYNFNVYKESLYVFVKHIMACEDDEEYEWFSGGFGFYTDVWMRGVTKTFDHKKEPKGKCGLVGEAPGGGGVPIDFYETFKNWLSKRFGDNGGSGGSGGSGGDRPGMINWEDMSKVFKRIRRIIMLGWLVDLVRRFIQRIRGD